MLLNEFFHHANWLAIIVAGLAYFVLGALWYSALFQKPWMAGHGISRPTSDDEKAKMKKQMPAMFSITLLMNLAMAMIIGMCVMSFGSVKCVAGIKLGLALSGVAVIPMVMSYLYLMKPVKVWIIDAAYHIVSIVLMTIILSVWH